MDITYFENAIKYINQFANTHQQVQIGKTQYPSTGGVLDVARSILSQVDPQKVDAKMDSDSAWRYEMAAGQMLLALEKLKGRVSSNPLAQFFCQFANLFRGIGFISSYRLLENDMALLQEKFPLI